MLSSELRAKCVKLDAKYNEFNKWNRPAILLIISIIVALIVYVAWVPEGKTVYDFPIIGSIVGIYSLVAVVIGIIFSQKARRYKITGFSKNTVLTFRSYTLLQKFLKDEIPSHLDKAESNMDKLLTRLQTLWGDSTSHINPPFKSLDTPIKRLIENLENRIIPAIKSDTNEKIEKTQQALELLIVFLLDENFEQIQSLNKYFETFPDVSDEGESSIERIKQNKHLVTSFYSLLMIGMGFVISQGAKLLSKEISIDTQLTLWVGISVPFIVLIILFRYRK